jgi:hypothetical protein
MSRERSRVGFGWALVLLACVCTFAGSAGAQPARAGTEEKATRKKKKPRIRKPAPAQKPAEKIAAKPVEKPVELKPAPEAAPADPAWTDPLVLRDTLFLSATRRLERSKPIER